MAARFLLILSIFGLLMTRSFGVPILKDATEPFRKNSTFQAILKISLSNRSSSNDYQTATLTISGDMFSLKIADQHIFCDAENNYTYTPSEKEIVIEKRDTLSPLYSPRSLLALDSSLFSIVESENNSTTSIYTLQNNKEIAGISSILVSIVENSLKRIVIIDNGGEEINIEIVSVDFNIKPDVNLFTFDKKNYKGIEIIDFR